MHIKYIWQANTATYKGGRGTLRCLKQDHIFNLNLLSQLVIITAPFLPVFQIREILAQIRIIGSVPEKTDPDMYTYFGLLT
jgi:hypothetical protein